MTLNNKDTEAPERIFLKACHPASPNRNCSWGVSKEPKDSVKYIRADLARVDPPAAPTEATLCDYRKDGCASTGRTVGEKWICDNHLSTADASTTPDEVDKALARQLIEGMFGKRGQSPIYGTAGRLLEELQDKFAAALAQARKQTWEKAIKAVPQVGVTFPEGYEEWIDAPSYREHVIAALESASKQER